jgi:hypothetical protein
MGASGTWLGASCCTSARRRAPAGRCVLSCLVSCGEPVDEGAALSGALLSYSADGSDG